MKKHVSAESTLDAKGIRSHETASSDEALPKETIQTPTLNDPTDSSK
jgi:hypothetical protein